MLQSGTGIGSGIFFPSVSSGLLRACECEPDPRAASCDLGRMRTGVTPAPAAEPAIGPVTVWGRRPPARAEPRVAERRRSPLPEGARWPAPPAVRLAAAGPGEDEEEVGAAAVPEPWETSTGEEGALLGAVGEPPEIEDDGELTLIGGVEASPTGTLGTDTPTRGVPGSDALGTDTLTKGVLASDTLGTDTLTKGVLGSDALGTDTLSRDFVS